MNSEYDYDLDMISDGGKSNVSQLDDDRVIKDDEAMETQLWGYLEPCDASQSRISFLRGTAKVIVGRGPDNHVTLRGSRVSYEHCIFVWDKKDAKSLVTLRDMSTNGTFINGSKIGSGRTRIIHDGDEIGIGSALEEEVNDYRFIFKQVVPSTPITGVHAKYNFASKLGAGGIGTVYRAVHKSTGKCFAVKMIFPGRVPLNAQDFLRTCIKREVQNMESLKHPNICKLYESFTFDGDDNIALVLELVNDKDLWYYSQETENGLDEHTTMDITYQLCNALAYLHKHRITHRDLKPDNILLTSDYPPIVKVADFGMSKAVDNMTMLKSFCGTYDYMAPEMGAPNVGTQGYNERIDSFALGVIVHVCVTKYMPFVVSKKLENASRAVIVRHRRLDMRVFNSRRLSQKLDDFVRCLLEKNPKRRLSMTKALQHPWLAGYTPWHNFPLSEYDPRDLQEVESRTGPSTPSRRSPKKTLQGTPARLAVMHEEEYDIHMRSPAMPIRTPRRARHIKAERSIYREVGC